MINILIAVAVCLAPLAWAIASWKLQMARSAHQERARASQRAIFTGASRGGDKDQATAPRRRRQDFGRR